MIQKIEDCLVLIVVGFFYNMNFDLNLENYPFHKILRFFGYKETDKLTCEEIDARSASLKRQLIDSKVVASDLLPKLDLFIEESVRWIQAVKCPPPKKVVGVRDFLPNESLSQIPNRTLPDQGDHRNMNHLIYPLPEQSVTANFVHTTDYVQGTRNPLHTQTIKKCLTIDSRYRKNYYTTSSTDFVFDLPEKLMRVVSMQISAFEIPLTFYNVSNLQNNHFFTLKIGYRDSNQIEHLETMTVIIADGNYNAVELITAINKILAPRNNEGDLLYPNAIFSYVLFSLNVTDTGGGTGKTTISFTENTIYTVLGIELYFGHDLNGNEDTTELCRKMGWMLGFQKKEYKGAIVYTGESIIDPGVSRYLFLAVDDYQRAINNPFISAFPTTGQNSDVLARITVKGTYFSILMADNVSLISEPRRYFGPIHIHKLRIRLLDEWGRCVDLNSANLSLCITFTLLYDMAI